MARRKQKGATDDSQPSYAKAAVDLDADLTRADFFRDLKKVAKKQDRPSRPDQEKR